MCTNVEYNLMVNMEFRIPLPDKEKKKTNKCTKKLYPSNTVLLWIRHEYSWPSPTGLIWSNATNGRRSHGPGVVCVSMSLHCDDVFSMTWHGVWSRKSAEKRRAWGGDDFGRGRSGRGGRVGMGTSRVLRRVKPLAESPPTSRIRTPSRAKLFWAPAGGRQSS